MKKTLSKKEIRELNERIVKYNFQFDKKERIEIGEGFIYARGRIMFFYRDDEWIPSLKSILDEKIDLGKIVVDMGAVKFVVNGADIMRPGIVEIEDGIEKEGIVEIVDVNNKKPLAVGRAMSDSVVMRAETKGKVVLNLHYVGDEIWGK